jgi:DNA mismatch repair protein MutS
MPAAVLNQARNTLQALEQHASASQAQVDLFAPAPMAELAAPSLLETMLSSMNPDGMSPREAMDALYQLKALQSKS